MTRRRAIFSKRTLEGETKRASTWSQAVGLPHNMLSPTHADAATVTVEQGAVIYADGTPQWTLLPIGAASTVLTSDGSVPSWQSLAGAGVAPADATYVVMSVTGSLTAERELAAGSAINIDDGGAGGFVTIDVKSSSNPGAAACVLNSSVDGLIQLVGIGITVPPSGSGIALADAGWIGLGPTMGRLTFENEATDEALFQGCNVGIGGSPTQKLHVEGNQELKAETPALMWHESASAASTQGYWPENYWPSSCPYWPDGYWAVGGSSAYWFRSRLGSGTWAIDLDDNNDGAFSACTRAIQVNQSAHVGINVVPSYRLHAVDNSASAALYVQQRGVGEIVIFGTQSNEWVTITTCGMVGIGDTFTPSYRLHIKDNSTSAALYLEGTGAGEFLVCDGHWANKTQINAYGYVGAVGSPQAEFHAIRSDSTTCPLLILQNQGTGDAAVQWVCGGSAYVMGIDNSDELLHICGGSVLGANTILTVGSGVLGAGVTSPSHPLDAYGGGVQEGVIKVRALNGSTPFFTICGSADSDEYSVTGSVHLWGADGYASCVLHGWWTVFVEDLHGDLGTGTYMIPLCRVTYGT